MVKESNSKNDEDNIQHTRNRKKKQERQTKKNVTGRISYSDPKKE